ncbi:MAG: hypothetical protein ACK4H7_03425, partial [Acidilobaceae archaeon]
PGELSESQLSFIFAAAIFQEFQVRGFDYLLPYIQVNRPYPGRRRKVDVFVKIPKSQLSPDIIKRLAAGSVCEENWIEVKFFRGAGRGEEKEKNTESGTGTSGKATTRNLGKMLEAMLRLKYYVKEGGKYLLLVFDTPPRQYLSGREYLQYILREGEEKAPIDLSGEPKTIFDSISDEKLRSLVKEKQVDFNLIKYVIKPIKTKGLLTSPKLEQEKKKRKSEYYFYLIRILEPAEEET